MAEQGFTLTSPAFIPDGIMPRATTCDGENRLPELKWMHAPPASRSFALIVDDPDAPNGTFTHCLWFDIPRDTQRLAAESEELGRFGRNDFQHDRFDGPCPPPNHGQHRYFFKLFALDVDSLELSANATRQEIEEAMQDHVLDQATLMGRYERTTG